MGRCPSLVDGFQAVMRKKTEIELEPWIDESKRSLIGLFATGITKDEVAVHAQDGAELLGSLANEERVRRNATDSIKARFRAAIVGLCSMDWPDHPRDQATKYRQLAEQVDDRIIKKGLLELASGYDEVASNIEDHLTGG